MANLAPRFWEQPLTQLNREEWEALCDGCGRCCLLQLEDEESGDRALTAVVCRYFNREGSCCSVYAERSQLVPECLTLNPTLAAELEWIPPTCAYRLRALGQPLPSWHPLVSGSAESVVAVGIAINHLAILETELPEGHDLEDFVIELLTDPET